MSVNETVAAPNSVDGLKTAIASYQKQQDGAQQQMAILDRNYQQQREQIVNAIHMLSGAMAALDQLIKNVEADAAKTADADATETVTATVTGEDTPPQA